jgi:hypothetical protein
VAIASFLGNEYVVNFCGVLLEIQITLFFIGCGSRFDCIDHIVIKLGRGVTSIG